MACKHKPLTKPLVVCLFLAFTLQACRAAAQPATPAPTSPSALQQPTTGAESPPEVPEPTLFDTDWLDRSVFAAGLLPSQQGTLDGLPGASVYHLDLRVHEDLAGVSGVEQVLYTNRQQIPLREVYFRLYPNLFPAASMSIQQTLVDDEEVQPVFDLENSLVKLPLQESLQPDEGVVIKINFEISLPPLDQTPYGMFGFEEGSLALPYAYPTIAVFDDEGWNVEIPPAWGEISFSETSFYRVRVTAPKDLTLISSGVEVDNRQEGEMQVNTYAAGPMRDFYLFGGRDLRVVSRELGGTTVNSYALPGMQEGAALALDLAAASLESFGNRLETFPYTEFDIVSTATTAGGIEYPAVIVINQAYYDLPNASDGLPVAEALERTVAHEVAHQWFYGLVGNDQVDEPWLDEAFAQYMTGLYYLDAHGSEAGDIYTQDWLSRWGRINEAAIPIGLPSSQYPGPAYSAIIYGRGPLFLQALARQMGEQQFDAFLKEYVRTYMYGVATGDQFEQEAEASCGCDLTEIFQRWVVGEGETTAFDEQGQPTPSPDGGRKIVLDAGVTFETAQAATDFVLRMPGYFPEGYEFKGVELTSSQEASLDYVESDPARLVVLVQTVVGASSQVSLVMGEAETQVVSVDGQEAKWTYDEAGDEATLEWTVDGVRYLLIGITDLPQAIKIAESIK